MSGQGGFMFPDGSIQATAAQDTRCDASGTCTQLCIGTACRSSWPGEGGSGPWTESGQDIYFGLTGGNVGIGTSPGERLDVNGDIRLSGAIKSTSGNVIIQLG